MKHPIQKIKDLKAGKQARIIAVLMHAFEPTFTINYGCKRCNKGRSKKYLATLGQDIHPGRIRLYCKRHGPSTYLRKVSIAMDINADDGGGNLVVHCKDKTVNSLFRAANLKLSEFLEEPCICKFRKFIDAVLAKQFEIIGKVTSKPRSSPELHAEKIREIKHVRKD